jgi:hypothetical protein
MKLRQTDRPTQAAARAGFSPALRPPCRRAGPLQDPVLVVPCSQCPGLPSQSPGERPLLRAERTNGMQEIALEPPVYHSLTEYAATIWDPGALAAPERFHVTGSRKPHWIEPA